jgi:hypothetical protein
MSELLLTFFVDCTAYLASIQGSWENRAIVNQSEDSCGERVDHGSTLEKLDRNPHGNKEGIADVHFLLCARHDLAFRSGQSIRHRTNTNCTLRTRLSALDESSWNSNRQSLRRTLCWVLQLSGSGAPTLSYTRRHISRAAEAWVNLFHRERAHESLGYRSPNQFAEGNQLQTLPCLSVAYWR